MNKYRKLITLIKNRYVIAILFSLVWITFFDRYDLISQIKLRSQLNHLKATKRYFENQIEEINKEKEALFYNKAMLEKFGREKYKMKKRNEDLFVVVAPETESEKE